MRLYSCHGAKRFDTDSLFTCYDLITLLDNLHTSN